MFYFSIKFFLQIFDIEDLNRIDQNVENWDVRHEQLQETIEWGPFTNQSYSAQLKLIDK